MDVYSARRATLQLLINEYGGVATLAARLGKDRTQVSQWNTGHRNISEESARAIEAKLRRPRGWLDGASAALATSHMVREPTPDQPYSWPFRVEYRRLLQLGAKERKQIDDYMDYVVSRWEESHEASSGTRTA